MWVWEYYYVGPPLKSKLKFIYIYKVTIGTAIILNRYSWSTEIKDY